jgi:hypothetical protein
MTAKQSVSEVTSHVSPRKLSVRKKNSAFRARAESFEPPDARTTQYEQEPKQPTPKEPISSWDFSKIPVSPSRQPDLPQVTSQFAESTLSAHGTRPSGVPMIQAQLTLGAVDDPLEREADQVANRVTASPEGSVAASKLPRLLSASGGEENLREMAPTSVDAALAGPSRPLDPAIKRDMEWRIGYDFSHVRVHSGSIAEESAREVGANAYAVGPRLIFAAGQYSPHTQRGRRLIAHELAHVIQQSDTGRSRHSSKRSSVPFGIADKVDRLVTGTRGIRVARDGGQAIPPVLSFLTPAEIAKLKGFGDADFQASLSALEGHLRKTKGLTQTGETQKYIDIRQAAGELRTFRDYISDPAIVAVKVVPSAPGGRSPDMYVRSVTGETRRVEISNITLASPEYRPTAQTDLQGVTRPRISRQGLPDDSGKTIVSIPVNEFDDTAIKAAIRSKIKASSKGPSQLEAQNPNTTAGGAPMAPGGDVVVQITHGEVAKGRVDQMIKELEPELLASAARRVQINSVDAQESRAGRKIFEYNREGNEFVGTVRKPNLPYGTELTPTEGSAALGTAMGPMGVAKFIGGAIFAALIQFALAVIISKITQKIEEGQVAEELEKIKPQIGDRLNSLAGDIMERQSASTQPVFAKIKYSLNYIHFIEDRATQSLYFGDSEHSTDTDQAYHEMVRSWTDVTVLRDAALDDVALSGGNPPPDSSSESPPKLDPYGTTETLTFTFEKAVPLQRFSDVELRDYVIQQALAEEMKSAEGTGSSDRASELEGRLNRLQESIAAAEERKRAERKQELEAEEQRKQAKLAQAREALKAPPPSSMAPLLPGPGESATEQTSMKQDPFNLAGLPQGKSLKEQAEDAADIAEALKAEFVRKADTLKGSSPSNEEIASHQKEVNEWIAALRKAFAKWRAEGSPDWPSVKRFEYLVWWVDQPEGQLALMLRR